MTYYQNYSRSDGFSLKWDLHPYFSIYALLSSNHKSRSTLSQHLLTKFSKIVFWIIKMADFKYHTVMMSRSANIMIWKSKIHNSAFSSECCDTAIFLNNSHFSPSTFFSKIDFVLKNQPNIILMLQKRVFNLFNVFEPSPKVFAQKLMILDP